MVKMFGVLYSIWSGEEFSKTHIVIKDSEVQAEEYAKEYVDNFNNGLTPEENLEKYGYNIQIEEIYEINSIDGYKIQIGEKI